MSPEDPRPRRTAAGAPLPRRIRLSASGDWAELAADDLTETGVVLSTGPDPAQLVEQSHVEQEDPSWLLHDYTHRMSSVLRTVSGRLWAGAAGNTWNGVGPAGEDVGAGPPAAGGGTTDGILRTDPAGIVEEPDVHAGPASALHLGAGALTMPRWIEQHWPTTAQTVVEIEPELVDFVLEHLPMRTAPRSIVADAVAALRPEVPEAGASQRELGETSPGLGAATAGRDGADPASGMLAGRQFDVVITDLFNSAEAPAALTSAEFYAYTLRALTPRGLLLMNLGDEAGMVFARAQVAKLLRLVPDPAHALLAAPDAVLAGAEEGNLVFAAAPSSSFAEPELQRIWAAGPHPGEVLTGTELTAWTR